MTSPTTVADNNNTLDIFPKLTDGETSVVFSFEGIHVDSPAYESTLFIPLEEDMRDFYLTIMTTENMYDHIIHLTSMMEVSDNG